MTDVRHGHYWLPCGRAVQKRMAPSHESVPCRVRRVHRSHHIRRYYEPRRRYDDIERSLKWETLLACYITGLPMDLVHGFGTAIFLMIAAEPMLEKMDRIKVKYGIAE